MGKLAVQVFLRATMALAVMSLVFLFIVERGSAEFYILIITGVVNCLCVIICLLISLIKAKNVKK